MTVETTVHLDCQNCLNSAVFLANYVANFNVQREDCVVAILHPGCKAYNTFNSTSSDCVQCVFIESTYTCINFLLS